MSHRLQAWDYRAPYHYLVTLKCLPGLPPLSRLDARFPWVIDPAFPMTRARCLALNDLAKAMAAA